MRLSLTARRAGLAQIGNHDGRGRPNRSEMVVRPIWRNTDSRREMARRATEYTWRTVTHAAAGDAESAAHCRAQAAHYADRVRRAGNP